MVLTKTIIGIAIAVFVPMLGEASIARRHERDQRARGAHEPPDDVYPLMRIAYPMSFVIMLAEAAFSDQLFHGSHTSTAVFTMGLVVFVSAKALKWWAIGSLGPAWTFRVLVVPGRPLVASGPYRFLRHPNYLAVLGEFIGVALMSHARVSGPVTTLVFAWLMLRRIGVEERALGVRN